MIECKYVKYLRPSSGARTAVLAGLMACAALFGQRPTESYNGRDVVARQVLVKIPSSNPALVQQLQQLLDAQSSRPVGTTGVHLFESRNLSVRTMIALAATQQIGYVEPNLILHATKTPNDPSFTSQWSLKNDARPGADIGATGAWDITTGSAANVIGVVDTGIDYNHPDLAANVWSAPTAFTVAIGGAKITCPAGSHGYNAILMTCDPMDDHGHGTHVSGTIGAVSNNGVGVSGINWTTRIMGLRFLDNTGSGSTSDAIDAIDFALQVKSYFAGTSTRVNLRALSNSYGGDVFSQAFLDEVNKAYANDVLFVAAAGNSGANLDGSASYPASYVAPNVITVAATDQSDNLPYFSNYGSRGVHLAAPGVSILSTVPGGGYAYYTGTSMAAPHVSGAAMLVLSACTLSTTELKQVLLTSVDPVPALAGKTLTGGRLNVGRAIQSCAGVGQPAGTSLPIRVHAGGGTITDSQGAVWNADYGYSGGLTSSTSSPIAGTSTPALYQTDRYAPGTLQYAFNVPNGNYAVTLKFAEILYSTAGRRVFNIFINGSAIQANFDIVAQAGAPNTAVDRTYYVPVSNGQILIQFAAVTDNPKVSAISIETSTVTAAPIAVSVSPASVSLGPSGTQQFSATISNAVAQTVTWTISPQVGTISASGFYQAPSSIASQQTVTVKATSNYDGLTSSLATVTLQPPPPQLPPSTGFVPIRVHAGGGSLTDNQGNVWSTDFGLSNGALYAVTVPIAGTSTPVLYQTERVSAGVLQYGFTVPNGAYAVTLKFAEIYFTTPGSRIFDIIINGAVVQSAFDIVAQAGAGFTALDRTYNVNVTNGQVAISLVGLVQNPKINAIQILSAGAVAPPTPPSVSVSPTTVILGPSGTQQFVATVANTTNQAVTWSVVPAIGTITQAGLYQAPATVSAQQTVQVKAISAADGVTFAAATVTLQPPAPPPATGFTPIRVNAGGGSYTDNQGNVWSADYGYTWGPSYAVSTPIANTSTPALYQTERFNSGTLEYTFKVPNGNYAVTLKFAEIYFTSPGQRVFNIVINGSTVESAFDAVARAGPNTAVDRTFNVSVSGGQIVIQLVGVIQNPKISAIQIAQN